MKQRHSYIFVVVVCLLGTEFCFISAIHEIQACRKHIIRLLLVLQSGTDECCKIDKQDFKSFKVAE